MDEGRDPDLRPEDRLREVERDVRRMRGAWEDWIPFLTELQDRESAREDRVAALISHSAIVVALIAAATVLAVTGHDSAPAWSALVAYIGGGAVQKATGRRP